MEIQTHLARQPFLKYGERHEPWIKKTEVYFAKADRRRRDPAVGRSTVGVSCSCAPTVVWTVPPLRYSQILATPWHQREHPLLPPSPTRNSTLMYLSESHDDRSVWVFWGRLPSWSLAVHLTPNVGLPSTPLCLGVLGFSCRFCKRTMCQQTRLQGCGTSRVSCRLCGVVHLLHVAAT